MTETEKPAISAKIQTHAPLQMDSLANAAPSVAAADAAVKDGLAKTLSTAEAMLAFNQSNFDAIVKSGQAFSAGMQELSKEIAAETKAYIEETMTTIKTQVGAKSLYAAVEVQTGLAQSLMKKLIADAKTRFEFTVRFSKQTMAPIKERMTSAAKF